MFARARELTFVISVLAVNAFILMQGTGVMYEPFSWKAFAQVYEDIGNDPPTGDGTVDPDADSLKGTNHDPADNFNVFNPSGCLYNEATGAIVPGGSVTAATNCVATTNIPNGGDPMNGSLGCFAFEYQVNCMPTFTFTITPPTGCVLSTACPNQGLVATSSLGGIADSFISIGNFPDLSMTTLPTTCTNWHSQITLDQIDTSGHARNVINNNIALDCSGLCGNGTVDIAAGETCDDGNNTSGDGCNSDCLGPEGGFTCPGGPGACSPICGDGMVVMGETCDDGDTTPGDGCDGNCMTEDGFSCLTPGAPCEPVCGDGMIVAGETCDDGNTTAGDGCDDTCMGPETGFTCPTPGAPCVPICGDGLVVLGEVCDDGNLSNNDGCLNDCSAAACGDGFICSEPTTCTSGPDGGPESCDDGDTIEDMYCTADCGVQPAPAPALDPRALAAAALVLLMLGAIALRRLTARPLLHTDSKRRK